MPIEGPTANLRWVTDDHGFLVLEQEWVGDRDERTWQVVPIVDNGKEMLPVNSVFTSLRELSELLQQLMAARIENSDTLPYVHVPENLIIKLDAMLRKLAAWHPDLVKYP